MDDGQEMDENTSPPPADAAGVVLARAPALGPRRFPLIHSLAAEIFDEISGRGRFLTVSFDDIREAAATFGPFFFCLAQMAFFFTVLRFVLSRYRLPTLDAIRHTALDARRMFLSDLRQLDRRSFPDTHLITQLLEHFKPLSLKSRANAKDPLFEEVVIPARLRNFRDDLSCRAPS